MPKLKTSDLIIIAILVLSVGALGAGVFYYHGQLATATAQRQAKEQELQSIKAKLARFSQLQDEVTQNEAAMRMLADYIPDREGQAEFIMELDQLSDSSGVKLKNCSVSDQPLPFPNLPEYQIYQWNVNLESNYEQLIKFLDVLPNQRRSALVSRVNITAVTPEVGVKPQARYKLNVQLTLDLIATAGQKKVVK